MLPYKDITLKARVLDREQVERKLVLLGAAYKGEDHQHDYYFDSSKGKLKFRNGTLFRLITHYERIFGGQAEKTIVYRYDVNPSEEDIQKLFIDFELLGEVQKTRKIYQIGNVTIHVDRLADGESYIEVEAKDFENNYSELELEQQCLDLFVQIGIHKVDLIRTGYHPI